MPTSNTETIMKIANSVAVMEVAVMKLDKAINGNGNPGIVEDHRTLQLLVSNHIRQSMEREEAIKLLAEETKKAKDKLAEEAKTAVTELAHDTKAQKDKISGRVWAIIIAAIIWIVTQGLAMLLLFIRTGGIK